MKKVLSVLLLFLCCRMAQAAEYTNSIGMEFVVIPAGSFYMGSCAVNKEEKRGWEFVGLRSPGAVCPSGANEDRDADDDETPQHKVTITRSFQFGRYEVTLGQFKQFIRESGRNDLLTDDFMDSNDNGDDAAVCMVSWEDAQDFIRWLNEKEGGDHYRLPTEAEWEYAARAGSITRYPKGDSRDAASFYSSDNPWGLYHMHGRVLEWCQDWYDEKYYPHSPIADPAGPSSGKCRVYRGGWPGRRTAARGCKLSYERYQNIGFRLVRQL